ncbi:MAG: glutathione binding-like protein [Thalassobaculum sp.]|uniref:glutathione binding-like protein n=1 Tax=Thalassobaculum sp. TaxID=2022740 RepID=UPI0032F04224
MKLYYSPGACSLAVHIALRLADQPFEMERVDSATKTTETGADYRAINPRGYVPALILDGGETITEAPALLQYVADQAPQAALAPAPGTLARTRLQEALNYIASELHKAFKPFFSGAPIADTDRPAAEEVVANRMGFAEAMLSDGRRHLVGDRVSVADLYLFTVANWCNFVGIDLGRWPNVQALVGRIGALPATRDAMAAEGLTG